MADKPRAQVRPGGFTDAGRSVEIATEVLEAMRADDSRFTLIVAPPEVLTTHAPAARFWWGSVQYQGANRAAAVAISDDGMFVVSVSLPHAALNTRKDQAEAAVKAALGHYPREAVTSDDDLDELNNLAIALAQWLRGELGPTPPLPPPTD